MLTLLPQREEVAVLWSLLPQSGRRVAVLSLPVVYQDTFPFSLFVFASTLLWSRSVAVLWSLLPQEPALLPQSPAG